MKRIQLNSVKLKQDTCVKVPVCAALALATGAAIAMPGGMRSLPVDWAASMPYIDAPEGNFTPTDIGRDFVFGETPPSTIIDANNGNDRNERGLAVVPADSGTGYWVLGSHVAGASVVPLIGVLSESGSITQKIVSTSMQMDSISAATKAVNNGVTRLYFAGTRHQTGFPDFDFGVLCLSPANNFQPCSGFGANGFTSIAFDLGGQNNDIAYAIAYDSTTGALYLGGQVETPPSGSATNNYAAAIVRLDGITGLRASSWGNQTPTNGTYVRNFDYTPNGYDSIQGLAVGSPGFFRNDVFAVGFAGANASGTDTDGFVFALDATNGDALDSGWNGGSPHRVFFDLGTTQKGDLLTAVSLRANGRLLIAGYASTDTATVTDLILGEYTGTGAPSTSFCGGVGVCHGPVTLGTHPIPTAVLERKGAGDVLVAATNLGSDGHPLQTVYQIEHGLHQVAGAGALFGSAVDTTPASFAAGIMVDASNRVLLTGYRTWSTPTSDYDATLVRFDSNDSIFGHGFGGVFAD